MENDRNTAAQLTDAGAGRIKMVRLFRVRCAWCGIVAEEISDNRRQAERGFRSQGWGRGQTAYVSGQGRTHYVEEDSWLCGDHIYRNAGAIGSLGQKRRRA